MPIRRISVTLVAAVLGACALFGGAASSAFAAKPSPASSTPFTLSNEYVNLNPYDPPWCLAEDDFHMRTWSGSLNGSFTASDYLCEYGVDYFNGGYWTPGGEGVYASAYVVGTLNNLTITSPTGDVHHAVLVGSSTSKGVTTSHYETCYMPPFSLSSGGGGTSVPGGTWSTTISGNFSSVSFASNIEMGYVNWQQAYCPPSEQNLVS